MPCFSLKKPVAALRIALGVQGRLEVPVRPMVPSYICARESGTQDRP